MADDKPIIVIKKKGGHGGHHGGAWKVAYADFVTAMMAFFMVMWLVNSAETKTKSAIASYFRRPGLFESGSGTPLLIGGAGILSDAYAPAKPDSQSNPSVGADGKQNQEQGRDGEKKGPFEQRKIDQPVNAEGIVKADEDHEGVKIKDPKEGGAVKFEEENRQKNPEEFLRRQKEKFDQKLSSQKKLLEELAKSLESKIKEVPEFKELLGLIEVTVDADGLTIEIMDTDKSSMFRSGSAQIQPASLVAFEKVSSLLKSLPNKIDIMGHTDAKPFSSRGGLSNWELSADRANAARRVLEQQGVPAERITSVVGRADRELRYPETPFNPSNRRISLKVKFEMEKIAASQAEAEALKDFKEIFPETFPQNSSSSQSDVAGGESSPEATITTPAPADTKQAESNGAYAPKVAVVGKEQKTTIALPAEPENSETSNPSPSRKIFKDDPVIGPMNPFFNN